MSYSKTDMNQIQINVKKKLEVIKNPFSLKYNPEEIVLSERQKEKDLPAMIYGLIKIPITSVDFAERVGRVNVFYVTPYKHEDPPFIFCSGLDLKEYYKVWNIVSVRSIADYERTIAVREMYEEFMSKIVGQIGFLDEYETAFLLVSLLDFGNKYVSRY